MASVGSTLNTLHIASVIIDLIYACTLHTVTYNIAAPRSESLFRARRRHVPSLDRFILLRAFEIAVIEKIRLKCYYIPGKNVQSDRAIE